MERRTDAPHAHRLYHSKAEHMSHVKLAPASALASRKKSGDGDKQCESHHVLAGCHHDLLCLAEGEGRGLVEA